LYLALCVWIYLESKKRGRSSLVAGLWAAGTFILNVLMIIIWTFVVYRDPSLNTSSRHPDNKSLSNLDGEFHKALLQIENRYNELRSTGEDWVDNTIREIESDVITRADLNELYLEENGLDSLTDIYCSPMITNEKRTQILQTWSSCFEDLTDEKLSINIPTFDKPPSLNNLPKDLKNTPFAALKIDFQKSLLRIFKRYAELKATGEDWVLDTIKEIESDVITREDLDHLYLADNGLDCLTDIYCSTMINNEKRKQILRTWASCFEELTEEKLF
jgi:hypothetical protein